MEFNLDRFIHAYQNTYQTALAEIKNGRKESHWMWYIFPQVYGLGRSSTSHYYAIHSLEEARAFLNDPYLGGKLIEISQVLLELDTNNAREIFPRPDDMKLRSSMTLFACVSSEESVFSKVLDKFFDGRKDNRTIKILSREDLI